MGSLLVVFERMSTEEEVTHCCGRFKSLHLYLVKQQEEELNLIRDARERRLSDVCRVFHFQLCKRISNTKLAETFLLKSRANNWNCRAFGWHYTSFSSTSISRAVKLTIMISPGNLHIQVLTKSVDRVGDSVAKCQNFYKEQILNQRLDCF